MTAPIIDRRRADRERMIERARSFAGDLLLRLPEMSAAVVFGSVARGDWNKWSDIDVLVVADGLSDDPRERMELAVDSAHPGVQAVLWTPAELDDRRTRQDPIACEAESVGVGEGVGVVVLGELPPHESRR